MIDLDQTSQVNVLPEKKKLRILLLAPFAPRLDASHGGGRAVAQLIARLSYSHSVALCYLRATGEPAIDERLMKCCALVEEVEIGGRDGWSRRLHMYADLLRGKPLWAIDRFEPGFEERVRLLLKTWHPDIVQMEFHIMGQYLSALKDYPAPRILVQHEPGGEAAREAIRSPLASGRIIPWLDLLAWQRFEHRILQQVQMVVVFTERDRQSMRKIGANIPVVQILLGTEIPEFRPDTSDEPLSLLFVGNFKHLPNLDAAHRLIHQIFPQVQSQVPEARLYVVGDHLPSTFVNRENANIICTGHVPDVKPYLERASIVVVPLRLGGGMRVKVLEALAHGKAVVASSRAVEGLDLVDGEHVILAEADNEFSRAIIDLLRHPHKQEKLATRARVWARENISWEKTVLEYEDLYQRLLQDQVSRTVSNE